MATSDFVRLNKKVIIEGSNADDSINISGNHSGINYFIFGYGGNDDLMGSQNDDVIFGGAGRDWLWGWNGNDTLFGGSGNDAIHGGNGDDTLSGGSGNDNLQGDAGNDTYLTNLGDGNTHILNYGYNDSQNPDRNDQLIFGEGIQASDVRATRYSNNLLLTIQSSNEVVTVSHFFYSSDYELQQVAFADGTIWTPESFQL